MTDRFRASLTALAPLLIAATSFMPSAASAQALFFHVEGAPGDRQAYYSMKPFRVSAAAGFAEQSQPQRRPYGCRWSRIASK